MVFDFQWFKQNIIHTHSAGEDKELEELLLSQGIHIEYADSIETLDEKYKKQTACATNAAAGWLLNCSLLSKWEVTCLQPSYMGIGIIY